MVERIFLWGYMSSGKSSYGLQLSKKLSWDFLDLDVLINSLEDLSIDEIFKQNGEDYFRQKEREALIGVCALKKVVIACGGGTPCFYDNAELMNQSGLTIYLNISSGFLFQRLEANRGGRPLALQETADLKRLWEERQEFYLKAHCIVAKPEQIHTNLLPLLSSTSL